MAKELLHAAHSVSPPSKILLRDSGAIELFAKTSTSKGEATAFVCVGDACQFPTSEAATLKEHLL